LTEQGALPILIAMEKDTYSNHTKAVPLKHNADYEIIEHVDETLYSIVYRACKKGELGNVILKSLKNDSPSPSEIARLKHEYDLIRSLNIEGVIKVFDIIDTGEGVTLVMEDFSGISIQEIIPEGFPMEQFLELAIRIAKILGRLHQGNIFHRDIKPSNILLNKEEDTIKITDFGIAAEFTRQNEKIYHPTVMGGTLAYISPEQTGRMNCAVDYRSDLYSLGITFYEMLTGEVPFRSNDAMEIIHSHIAKEPLPPRELNPDIPEPLSRIVKKLLSKEASKRYQNGFGLAVDLRVCLDQIRSQGQVEPFELGSQDISLRFIIPQTLQGRDKELEDLYKSFEKVSLGAVEVIMVTGAPGIGKSALINDIHKSIVEKRGYFIAGKYDQFQRAAPYSAIIQAFQNLVQQLLTENDERIMEWEKRFLSALGANAKIITDAIPTLELIIGKQPDVPLLGAEENQNRFHLVIKNFVRAFASQAHPLLIFLDDLQWADNASFDLIQNIITDPDLHYMLFIGAYRDTEVASHHPLLFTCEVIQAEGFPLRTVHLAGLKPEDINTLLLSFLHSAADPTDNLAKVIHDKTNGSPFFVNQFLKTLYDKHHLTIDPVKGWQWDIQKIQDLHVTENVVEFMAEKLQHLAEASRRLISICACIGNRFDLETIADISGQPLYEVLSVIDSLMQDDLINHNSDFYWFHHDRIHEAAYSLLSVEEREDIHYQIGMHVLEWTSVDDYTYNIYHITDQLNQGRNRMKTSEERIFLADLNLKAGIKAKDASAYSAAGNYLSIGISLLSGDTWQSKYDLSYALHLEQIECQYLNQNFDEAEKIFGVIIANAISKKDKAMAYNTMVILYTNMRTPKEAIDLGLKALTLYGIHISPNVGVISVVWDLIQTLWFLKKIPRDKVFRGPPMEDEDMIANLLLMLSVGTPSYYFNQNLFAKLTLKGINMGLRHGHSPPYAAGAIVALATIIQTALGKYELGYRLGEIALELSINIDNRKTAGMVNHGFAFFIQHWKGSARNNLDIFRKAYQLSLDVGNFIYAGHSINARADCSLMVGVRLDDVLEDNNKYADFIKLVKDPFIAARFQENNQYIFNLKSKTDHRLSLSGPGYNEEAYIRQLREEKNIFGLCFALHYKMKLFYLYGEYEEAFQLAEELTRHIKVQVGTLIVPEYYFYYSLILTALISDGQKNKLKYKIILKRNLHKMRTWSKLSGENFQHKYDLVAAEIMAVKHRYREAQNLYRKAIEGARQNEYLNEEAIACERLSLFYLRESAKPEARVYMQRAYRCYKSWGALAKELELKKRYPDLLRVTKKTKVVETHDLTISSDITSRTIDFSAVMKVSQIISEEIRLDRLLTKIMHLSVINAGAQRGFLILASDDELTIEASADVSTNDVKVMQTAQPLKEFHDLCQAIVNYVSNSGKDVILGNAIQDGTFTNDRYIIRSNCKSILCIPIMSKGTLTGILYMENNLSVDAFTPERIDILRIISTQAAISIENARLFELATTDGLTKLYVNRYFQIFMDKELQRSARYKKQFGVILMDIDNFKLFNDTYGHQLGDKVLRTMAAAIIKVCRAEDIAARYGGEEFVMILPETNSQQALIVAEKVRTCVADLKILHGSETLRVTISLGVSVYPRHSEEKKGLIYSADVALYTSKRRGKNRVTLFDKNDDDR
jgi:diguanylate cyclase (GGDEF)-like protein